MAPVTEWLSKSKFALSCSRLERCEASHGHHQIRPVLIEQPSMALAPMCVFDAELYANTPGYCTGDDDVSRTLIRKGKWEDATTHEALVILGGQRWPADGVVIDIGAHVGWYSVLALRLGYRVLAVNANPEHYDLLEMNARAVNAGDRLWQACGWIDENTPSLSPDGAPPILLAKVDIEGNEQHAIRVLMPLIEAGLVENIIMEVSPVFNDSYGSLVRRLARDYNCEIIDVDNVPVVDERNQDGVLFAFDQADFLFTRRK